MSITLQTVLMRKEKQFGQSFYRVAALPLKAGSQGEKTIADNLMYFTNNETQNYPFCRLRLVVET